jgi:hypothetical protein
VSLCPLMTGSLVSVVGGNAALSRGLLAGANVLLGTRAAEVEVREGRLRVIGTDGRVLMARADAVFVAAPLEASGLRLCGLAPPPRAYQRTVATFVRGTLDGAYFKQKSVPDVIMLTAGAAASRWTSIRKQAPGVYRLFSPAPLASSDLDEVFAGAEGAGWSVLGSMDWGGGGGGAGSLQTPGGHSGGVNGKLVAGAYPLFSAQTALDSFVPCGGAHVYYLSALEQSVSALEISVLAARNAVGLFVESRRAAEKTRAADKARAAAGTGGECASAPPSAFAAGVAVEMDGSVSAESSVEPSAELGFGPLSSDGAVVGLVANLLRRKITLAAAGVGVSAAGLRAALVAAGFGRTAVATAAALLPSDAFDAALCRWPDGSHQSPNALDHLARITKPVSSCLKFPCGCPSFDVHFFSWAEWGCCCGN